MSTQRTKAQLDVLFADNTTRQITPENLRDFLESCVPSYGAIHFDDPGTPTAFALASTWTKAANTSTLHNGAHRFSQPASNRLRYDGVTSVVSHVAAAISFTASANNKLFSFAIGVNGTPIAESKSSGKIAAGADMQHVSVMSHPTLAPGDYIELFVMNETDTASITIAHAHITAMTWMI